MTSSFEYELEIKGWFAPMFLTRGSFHTNSLMSGMVFRIIVYGTAAFKKNTIIAVFLSKSEQQPLQHSFLSCY